MARLLGKPSTLAIRSGAFSATEFKKKELCTVELDLQCKLKNKDLCYVDIIAEKPSFHETRKIFERVNRTWTIISDREIITTLREPELKRWNSRGRRAAWSLSKKIESYPLSDQLQEGKIPAQLDGGAAISIVSKQMATKLGLSTFKLKKGITIRAIGDNKSKWNEFTYAQIRLPNCMEEWRAIILCVVMDSDETPLLIGSNDQAAYAIHRWEWC